MTTNQVSLNSVASNPAYTNPYAKTDQPAATSQVRQDAQKSVQSSKTDTVTISQQALQMINGNKEQDQSPQSTATAKTDQSTSAGISYPGISK